MSDMSNLEEKLQAIKEVREICKDHPEFTWMASNALKEIEAEYKRKEKESQIDRIQFITTIVVTGEDIDDIMVSALEGGITYWATRAEARCSQKCEYASDAISRGGSILILDGEEDATYELTKAKILQGIRLYAEQPKNGYVFEIIDHELHIDCGQVDAEVADSIIQYALFGEVIYG